LSDVDVAPFGRKQGSKMAKENSSRLAFKSSRSKEKIHPWRLCPLGEHWVKEHALRVPPSKTHPVGTITTRRGHCAKNPSGKDQLYFDEMQEIAERNFSKLTGAPTTNNLGFKYLGNRYDHLIRGWTQFWNEVFQPKEQLDPNLVKALIASESSFDRNANGNAGKHNTARGLMQVTDQTLGILADEDGELRDHLINLTQDQIYEPSANIGAGIRWLFRKQETTSAKLKRNASWIETVADYKSYLRHIAKNPRYRGMGIFMKYYDKLHQ